MLIGIDMIGVQSAGGEGRAAGRYGRQLARALLARDPVNRYVLYCHEGLSTERIPSASNALRVSLAPDPGRPNPRRAAVQRLLDRDPDGLDWLVLLDPFAAAYDGLPPEAPLKGPRVASVVHDSSPRPERDRRLVPLRRHDAVLAVSDELAADYRSLMGPRGHRVATIGLATDETFGPAVSTAPLTRCGGAELGRLGICGPFVFTRLPTAPSTADLLGSLDPYRRLPIELRRRHQLVVAGGQEDPAPIRAFLRAHGADEALVLVGEVTEQTLATLYARCSAFLAPAPEGGSGLEMVEAMKSGAPVIGATSPSMIELVGDAGLIVRSSDPSRLVEALDDLLSDDELASDLRRRALARSARFSFDGVVPVVLDLFGAKTATRFRFDRGHGSRPRIAVFFGTEPDAPAPPDLEARLPVEWLDSYAVDIYLEPGLSARVDGFPAGFGGFDARLFERNDAILGYQCVVSFLRGDSGLDAITGRHARRPGLVVLEDHPWLDRSGPDLGPAGLVDLLRAGSRLVVRSRGVFDRVAGCLPDFAAQLVEIPPIAADLPDSGPLRLASRTRLDLLPGAVAIGLFGCRDSVPLESLARAVPQAVFLDFGPESPGSGPLSAEKARDVCSALDLAIFRGDSEFATLPGLARAGVPAIDLEGDAPGVPAGDIGPEAWTPRLVDLISDRERRAALYRSLCAYYFGVPDASRASGLFLEQIGRCAAELRRGPDRRRRMGGGSAGLPPLPHSPRAALATGESASR